MEKTLKEGLTRLGLDLPEERQEKLCAFARAMVKQNEVMNLTAITEDTQVAKLHLLDSLTVLCCADLRGKKLIDVGCGAGFPGVPLAIACPEAKVTLLDSLGKRMKWLEEILPGLGISARCVTARAEEAVADCGSSTILPPPGRLPAEHSAGADGSLCEGGRRGAGHEGYRRGGRAGRVRRGYQKAGAEAGGSAQIPH